MARRIVLLSDGTGNSSAKVWRTNVWRVFESLDLSGSEQVAFYDDGVGTASFKPLAILGGAFGFGLKRNVIDLYKFACRNVRDPTDEIYGFGFSRGAFTIRVVIGLIVDQGLVRADSEPELHAKAVQAYRAYRAAKFKTVWPDALRPERWARTIRDLILPHTYRKSDNRHEVRIRFLGLWDTVAAYGTPVEEMTRGISKFVWPLMLPDCELNARVERACHALSIDDERTTFHPVLWDERKEPLLTVDGGGKRYIYNERISQVWFTGVHSNVGGGYPEDSLAQIPLVWIMSEAQRTDLRFKSSVDANPQTVGHPLTVQDKDGRLYDPRAGLGGYYRYGPRDILALGRSLLARKDQASAVPRIHESVLKRIRNRAHAYAPIGLPDNYDIVRDNGEVLPSVDNPYEHSEQSIARCHDQQRVWNLVWWRRIVYFLTVAVSIYLFVFPISRDAQVEDAYSSPIGWVSDGLELIQRFLPVASEPWINGYRQNPVLFLFVIVVLCALLGIASKLAGKIQSRMDLIWRESLGGTLRNKGAPTDVVYRLRTHLWYVKTHQALKTQIAPAFFAIVFLYLSLAVLARVAFGVQNYAGGICKSAGDVGELASGELVLANGHQREWEFYSAKAKNDSAIPAVDKGNHFRVMAHYGQPLPEFGTSELCQSLRIRVERPGKYQIRLESTDSFKDFDGKLAAPFGYGWTGVVSLTRSELRPKETWQDPSKPERQMVTRPPSGNQIGFWQSALSFVATPFRRELMHPWFRVVVRVGQTGAEEHVLNPDFNEARYFINDIIDVQHKGELFIFVNDGVVGIPGLQDLFYRNNRGSTRVLILRR